MSGRTNTARFRVNKAAVPQARAHVEALLKQWKLGHLTGAATLMVGELAANAVTHAQGIGDFFEVSTRRRDGMLIIEVADSYQWGMPELRKPGPDETTGRGLLLVDALAQAWGVRQRAGAGKTVWVHLPVSGTAGPPCGGVSGR